MPHFGGWESATVIVSRRDAIADSNAPTSKPDELLVVQRLRVEIESPDGALVAVNGIDIRVGRGEIVGVVGESGSGKTLTALSILRLVRPPIEVVGGEVWFEGSNLLALNRRALRSIRGARIGFVFQNAISALNPVMRVGEQIAERLRLYGGLNGREARERAVDLLAKVGIPRPKARARSYPHEFSGGMAQRVMIAAAIANGPPLLIADEPTTALDATTQAQIMELLMGICADEQMAMILITHNLGLAAGVCDRIYVMYGGRVMEHGPVDALFGQPAHPYTRGLLAAVPRPDTPRGIKLQGIDGSPPELDTLPIGCPFFSRCSFAAPFHGEKAPPLVQVDEQGRHYSACWIAEAIVALPLDRTDVSLGDDGEHIQ